MTHASFSPPLTFITGNELAREQQQTMTFKPGDVVMLVNRISEILEHPFRHQRYGREHLRQVHDVFDSLPGDFDVVRVGLCIHPSDSRLIAGLEIYLQPPTYGCNAMRVAIIKAESITVVSGREFGEEEQATIYERLAHALLAFQVTSPLGGGITGYRHPTDEADDKPYRYPDVVGVVVEGLMSPHTTVFASPRAITQTTLAQVASGVVSRPTEPTLALATLACETSPPDKGPVPLASGLQLERVRDAISAIQRVIDAVPYGMGYVGDLDTDFRVKEYPAVGQAVREVREYLDETVHDTCMYVLAEFDDEVSIEAIRDRGDLRVRLNLPCGHINLRPYY